MSKSDHSSDSDNDQLSFQVSQNQLIKGYQQNYEMYKKKAHEFEGQLKKSEQEKKELIDEIQKITLTLKETQMKLNQALKELQEIKNKEERRNQRNSSRTLIKQDMSDQFFIEQNRAFIESLISDHSQEDINTVEGDALKAFSRVLKKENKGLKQEITKAELRKKQFMTDVYEVLHSQNWSQSLIKSEEGKQVLLPFMEKMHEKMEKKNSAKNKQMAEQEKGNEIEAQKKEQQIESGLKEKFMGELYSNLRKFKDDQAIQNSFEGFFEEVRQVIEKNTSKQRKQFENRLNEQRQEIFENFKTGINYIIDNIQFLEDEDAQLTNQLPEFDDLCKKIQNFIQKIKRDQSLKRSEVYSELEELRIQNKRNADEMMNLKDEIARLEFEKSQIEKKAQENQSDLEMQRLDLSQLKTTIDVIRRDNLDLRSEIAKMRKESDEKSNIPDEVSVDLFSIFQFLEAYLTAIETPIKRLRAKNQIAWFVTKVIQI